MSLQPQFFAPSLAQRIVVLVVLTPCLAIRAQIASGRQQNQISPSAAQDAATTSQPDADQELRQGTGLTRQGAFLEAIPHLLAARGRVANEYAASFNLALCYVGTSQFKSAMDLLNALRTSGHDDVDVENLLAQAYVGNSQPQEALAALQKAAALSPKNEKLYAFIADACTDHRQFRLGLRVVDLGLRNLPQSARLHYERAMFLSQLDSIDQAKQDFELAAKLAPGSEIGVLSSAHEHLLTGDIAETIRIAREGVKKGFENPALLTLLGEALIRSGASPGQPDFAEAQALLENAVSRQPNDAASQITLGCLDLAADRLENAILHLQKARHLEPDNPAVYSNLAKAYQRHGDTPQAQDTLATLQKLNQDQAARINSASGDHKLGYASPNLAREPTAPENR